MSSADLHQTTRAPYVASMKRRQAAEAPSRWWASCPRVNLDQHLNLVAVDFIGGDGAEGSIPCLEDDDRDHERGGEGGGEGVGIFAGHLFGSCLGGGGPSPARQDPAGPKTG